MKNLLTKILVLLLATTLSLSIVACGDGDYDDAQTTGYKYKIVTEERAVDGSTTGEKEEYKYAVITGFEISSDDAEKISNGDYSTVVTDNVNWRELEIPETYKYKGKTYNVEKIDAAAFAGHTLFTSIKVGANIKAIGEGAFGGCTNLKSLTIPFVGASADAVGYDRIFAYLFSASHSGDGNTEIKSKYNVVTDSNGDNLVEEEESTFYIPTALKTVTITGGENIPTCAFYNVTTLETINLPTTVKDIDSHAFFGCSSLRSIDLSNVENVYAYGLSNCSSLKSINFGENPKLKTVWEGAFSGCTKLCSSVLSDESLTTLTLPSTLEVLKKSAFEACSSIKKVDLSASKITDVARSAFANCTSIEKIVFKNGTIVRTGAFTGCLKIEKDNITGEFTFEQGAFSDSVQEELEKE